jgi:hypothetical protein
VLTLYRFPTWANGVDRMSQAEIDAAALDRIAAGAAATSAKSLLFKYPDDVLPQSAWGDFVDRIASRYSAGNLARPSLDATIDVLEIANEPNLQCWPQQGRSTDPANAFAAGPVVIHDVLARMFATAKTIVARYGEEPALGGPASADSVGDTRPRTGYDTLADRLLQALRDATFTGGDRFVWTHHNYTDVTFDQGAGTAAPDAARMTRRTNFAADVRRRLIAGGWAGWPAADPADPGIMLTEGGVTIQSIRNPGCRGDARRPSERRRAGEGDNADGEVAVVPTPAPAPAAAAVARPPRADRRPRARAAARRGHRRPRARRPRAGPDRARPYAAAASGSWSPAARRAGCGSRSRRVRAPGRSTSPAASRRARARRRSCCARAAARRCRGPAVSRCAPGSRAAAQPCAASRCGRPSHAEGPVTVAPGVGAPLEPDGCASPARSGFHE